jgi:hypothetical protein
VPEDEEPYDGYVERALLDGEFTPLEAPLRPGEFGAVARWIGTHSAAVLEFSYDAEAEPGNEYDAFLWTFNQTPTGEWEADGGPGFDCPLVPGDRPVFSVDVLPIEGLSSTTYRDDGTVFTIAIAAPEIAAVEFHSGHGVTRSEVGVFGAVILAAEQSPAVVVLLDINGEELRGRWHPQIHTDFTVRSTLRQEPPTNGRY